MPEPFVRSICHSYSARVASTRAKDQSLYVRLDHWDPLRKQSAQAAFGKADNLRSHPEDVWGWERDSGETRSYLGQRLLQRMLSSRHSHWLRVSRRPILRTLTEWQEVPSVIHDSEEMSHWVEETGQIQTSLYIMESPAKPADLASYQAREGRHSRNMLSIFN